jgi:hypothetical protein
MFYYTDVHLLAHYIQCNAISFTLSLSLSLTSPHQSLNVLCLTTFPFYHDLASSSAVPKNARLAACTTELQHLMESHQQHQVLVFQQEQTVDPLSTHTRTLTSRHVLSILTSYVPCINGDIHFIACPVT